MSFKIYGVTPEGEAKIIDFLDKVFSKDNEEDDLQSMDEVDFWHYDMDPDCYDCDPDCGPEVIMNRKDSYIRASNCALEYYRQSDMYSIFACPVTKEQINLLLLQEIALAFQKVKYIRHQELWTVLSGYWEQME